MLLDHNAPKKRAKLQQSFHIHKSIAHFFAKKVFFIGLRPQKTHKESEESGQML